MDGSFCCIKEVDSIGDSHSLNVHARGAVNFTGDSCGADTQFAIEALKRGHSLKVCMPWYSKNAEFMQSEFIELDLEKFLLNVSPAAHEIVITENLKGNAEWVKACAVYNYFLADDATGVHLSNPSSDDYAVSKNGGKDYKQYDSYRERNFKQGTLADRNYIIGHRVAPCDRRFSGQWAPQVYDIMGKDISKFPDLMGGAAFAVIAYI